MKRFLFLLLISLVFLPDCSREATDLKGVISEIKPPGEWIEMLNDKNPCNRTAAILALEKMGPDVVPELIKVLQEKDARLRHDILAIFYDLGPEAKAAVPCLVSLIQDPDEAECNRLMVGKILWKMGPDAKESVPVLVGIIKDKNEPECIRVQTAKALRQIGPDSMDVVPILIELIKNSDDCKCLRVLCTKTLRKMAPMCKDAVPALVAIVTNKKEKKGLRISAAKTLGFIGPEASEAVPALMDIVKDKHESRCIRILATNTLGHIGPDARVAIPTLSRASVDEDFWFKKAIQKALNRIKESHQQEERVHVEGMRVSS